MTLTTPAGIAALPNSVTVDVTLGLDTDLITVYDYLKTLAADINGEITALATLTSEATPVGTMKLFGGGTVPTGWLFCRGQAISRTTYSALFSVLAITYGNGNGTSTFNLPNLQGRVPAGHYPGGDIEFDTLGETGGAKTHSLSLPELASHNHAVGTLGTASHGHSHTFSGKGDAVNTHNHNQVNTAATGGTGDSTNGTVTTSSSAHTHTITGSSSNTGSGIAHQNLQPYQVVNYMIKT